MSHDGLAIATSAKLLPMKARSIPGLGRRVEETYSAAGLNRHKAAMELGLAYSTLFNWEQEKTVPDIASLIPLARLGGVRVEWLLTGEGPKFVDEALNAEQDAATVARKARYRKAVDDYLASQLAAGIGPKVVMLLKGFDFSALGIDHPEVRDVARLRDLIEARRAVGHLSTDEPHDR